MKISIGFCLLVCVSVRMTYAETLAETSFAFSWNSYRALKVDAEKNIFFSPYSIENALSMLVLGSTGTTEADLIKVLSMPQNTNTKLMHEELQAENTKLSTETEATIGVANRFFVAEDFVDAVNPAFSSDLKKFYNASLTPTPFATDPTAAKNAINQFVSDNTRGEIPQLLSDNLPDTTILSLINAIYFKGLWTTPFSPDDTFEKPFHAKSGDVQVDMMHLKPSTSLPYAECADGDCQFVSLHYTNASKYSMNLIVPKVGLDLDTLEANLNPQKLAALKTAATSQKVNLQMPRFSLDNQFSLKDMLANLGAKHIFGLDGAGNSKIFSKNVATLVDDIIHEAKVKVDEAGTVAAAATAVFMATYSAVFQDPDIKIVNLDRPFIFFITDQSNDFVLFWGRVANPTQS